MEIISGKARRRSRGKVDYVLRVKINPDTQPVAVALIEAKKDALPPGHGLDQAKGYAACKRLNVPFVFSSNGHMFVEFDDFRGLTSTPRPLSEFPSPDQLRARYEERMGFSLSASQAKPLLQPYAGGEGTRRYYQDAAIRAVFEKCARCALAAEPQRALPTKTQRDSTWSLGALVVKNGINGKKLATQQSVDQAVKAICDIMRRGNCAGALQYVPELTWILFLRILDEREEREQHEAEALGVPFRPSLAHPYRWQDWAAPTGEKRKELQEGAP